MRRLLFLLLILVPSVAFSQTFINQSREEAKKELQKDKSGKLMETDSSLVMTAIDKSWVIVYGFDEAGQCQSERIQAGCDACFSRLLKDVLSYKKYHWKKVNENQYISDFDSKRMIELPVDEADKVIVILRTNWTKELYRLLVGN